ncbi:MAG: T9SS type A sorting domain-containing protein [Ignavibacterium sp.]|nr:T9SS type A sorting domain-containing protein [Ignavibacterium sp.]MDW8375528.1 T9SS type A sorting domain-containing protein [Ignavibacteriales bacterium]
MKKLTLFVLSFLLSVSLINAQDQSVFTRTEKDIYVTGNEPAPNTIVSDLNLNGVEKVFEPFVGETLTWTVTQMTSLATGYDLQSNASTQQLWYHKATNRLHAVFTTSQQASSWTDRTVTYLVSTNNGASWTNLGNVPPAPPAGARAGFPAIDGLADGSAVISSHHNLGGVSTRTQISIDAGPGAYSFVHFDAQNTPDGTQAIWPRHRVTAGDNISIASSVSGGGPWTNYFNSTTAAFAGWQSYVGGTAETYSIAVSPGGKVGHLYLGTGGGDSSGYVYYRESTNNGQTWGTPQVVFRPYLLPNDTTHYAPIRGLSLTFLGEQPAAVFEAVRRSFSTATYFPGWRSHIRFWRPGVNQGNHFIIADSSTAVPAQPNQGVADVMTPICRPVIARGESGNYLFVAFSVAGPDTGANGTRIYEGYFMYSSDGGVTWSTPERFTPRGTPRLDFRYISIAPVIPLSGGSYRVHLVAQGDVTPGSQVNGATPAGVSAQFFHFTTTIAATGVEDEIVADKFELSQNYPNPFNPSTTINFSIAERSNVSLKVYDMLGKEVATLVDEVKEAGQHTVNFNASNLASGIYVYKLVAGNFTASKKMVLMK